MRGLTNIVGCVVANAASLTHRGSVENCDGDLLVLPRNAWRQHGDTRRVLVAAAHGCLRVPVLVSCPCPCPCPRPRPCGRCALCCTRPRAPRYLLSKWRSGTCGGVCFGAPLVPGIESPTMEPTLPSEVLGGAGIAPLSVPNGLGVLLGRGVFCSGTDGAESLED